MRRELNTSRTSENGTPPFTSLLVSEMERDELMANIKSREEAVARFPHSPRETGARISLRLLLPVHAQCRISNRLRLCHCEL